MLKRVAAFVFWFLVIVLHEQIFAQGVFHLEGKISLDSLTRFVHESSGVRFSFNSVKVKGSKQIYFSKGTYSFSDLLKYIKKNTSLEFTQYKGYVIFSDHPKTEVVNSVSQSKHYERSPEPGTNHKPNSAKNTNTVTIGNTHHRSMIPITNSIFALPRIKSSDFKETLKTTTANAPQTVRDVLPGRLIPEKTETTSQESYTDKISNQSGIWHLQFSVYGSDALYANFGTIFGADRLHIYLFAGTNFQTIVWQYGLGSVLLNRPSFQLELTAGTGIFKENLSFDSMSLKKNLVIQGRLYNAGLSLNKKQGNWLIKVTPNFNFLTNTYYENGQATNLSAIPLPLYNLQVLHPFFPKTNYSLIGSTLTTKWIGLSVAVYYQLF